MHRIMILAALIAALVLPPVPATGGESAPESASAEPPAAWREGAVLETQTIPELGQTIVYVRFPDAIAGPAALEFVDSTGEVRATATLDVVAGRGMWVWDGRDGDGEPLPSDLWTVQLTLGERELAAPLVR